MRVPQGCQCCRGDPAAATRGRRGRCSHFPGGRGRRSSPSSKPCRRSRRAALPPARRDRRGSPEMGAGAAVTAPTAAPGPCRGRYRSGRHQERQGAAPRSDPAPATTRLPSWKSNTSPDRSRDRRLRPHTGLFNSLTSAIHGVLFPLPSEGGRKKKRKKEKKTFRHLGAPYSFSKSP